MYISDSSTIYSKYYKNSVTLGFLAFGPFSCLHAVRNQAMTLILIMLVQTHIIHTIFWPKCPSQLFFLGDTVLYCAEKRVS